MCVLLTSLVFMYGTIVHVCHHFVCGLNLDMHAFTACCLGGRSVRAMFLRIVSGS